VVAGDGPYLQEYRGSFSDGEPVFFTGLLDQTILPYVYSGADLFVFPSTSDTFGMAVLEAQACGLPAVVSDIGGPQEIIADGETGRIAVAGDLVDWEKKLAELIEEADGNTAEYRSMHARSTARVHERFDWEQLFDELFARHEERPGEDRSPRIQQPISASLSA
jgi:glycosyltransferase involved in cell wall biosynthesis